MTNQFHRNLNRMALFAAFVVTCIILFFHQFMQIACTNIWLNGVIVGVTLFGMALCFADIFKLVPEYRWVRAFFGDKKTNAPLPPRILRPVAMILQGEQRGALISPGTLGNFLEIIVNRFEDQRESVRYITNTLIFLGLLGTFWGLIHTVGGFAELVGGLNFDDENIMNSLQAGLAVPLRGMGVAFTSSLLGLGGSLVVGFLGLQVQMAQNTIFRDLEEYLATRTKVFEADGTFDRDTAATEKLTSAVEKLEKTVAELT